MQMMGAAIKSAPSATVQVSRSSERASERVHPPPPHQPTGTPPTIDHILSNPSAQASRAGVALGAGALTYNPSETLSLAAIGLPDKAEIEIAWEATGGAAFTSNQGCSGRRSIAAAPELKMPTNGATVTVWAGYATGPSTVYVTPKITLTGQSVCIVVCNMPCDRLACVFICLGC